MDASAHSYRQRVFAGIRAVFPIATVTLLAGCMLTGDEPAGLLAEGDLSASNRPAAQRLSEKPAPQKVHKVVAGETMYSISRKHKLKPDVVARYNRIPKPYIIRPGQLIRVPDLAYAMAQGRFHFAKGDYGLAERHFRRAVEYMPEDPDAWVGLAASYDRLRRFDRASRAYNRAIKIAGRTPAVLNNLGYSYMLRGDFEKARKVLLAAKRKEPNNPVIRNNLKLLDSGWRRYGRRERQHARG